jgi:thiol-disulfide isomerase/thioredoxin
MKPFTVKLLLVFTLGLVINHTASAQVKEVQFQDLKKYLHKNNDTLYVINFWATWCGPCVEELPYFERLNQKFNDRPVSVLLVSLDFSKNVESKVIPFVEKRDLKSRVLFLHQPRGHKWMNDVSESWTGAIPATCLVRNSRKKAFLEQPFDNYRSLLDVVESHL